MNNQEHETRLKEATRLTNKLEIRKELKYKLFYFYPNIFEGLFNLLSVSETIDFWHALQMHFAARTFDEQPDKDNIDVNFWLEPNINYLLLIQEIFDDYWASFVLFSHGFTKQSLETLRNTYELILVLYYLKFCNREDNGMVDWLANWMEGKSGVPTVEPMINCVKKIEFLLDENVSPYLANLWDILCTATHSHKKMMTSITVPADLWIRDKKMFEDFAVVQTRAIFLFVIETELKMMKCFFENDEKTPYSSTIKNSFVKMQEQLQQYSSIVENIKKGYILHRKPIRLNSGKTVLFSLKINNEPEIASKVRRFSSDELKDLNNKISRLLLATDAV